MTDCVTIIERKKPGKMVFDHLHWLNREGYQLHVATGRSTGPPNTSRRSFAGISR